MVIQKKTTINGFKIPVFGLGTWLIGGSYLRGPAINDQADIDSIVRAIDSGITHIDTAEMYAEGHAEKIVAKAIKPFKREDLFIASKVWSTNLSYDDLIRSAHQSLCRLETTYLDLYYIHKPNQEIPIEESMRAMDVLVDEGLVRNIGLSNFTPENVERAQTCSRHKISAVQAHYNLIYREPEEKGLIDYCQKNDIILVAWRPLQSGVLSSSHIPLMHKICKKYNKTHAQVAINWLISQPNVVTISTMRSSAHLEENLGSLDWRMSQIDVDLLKDVFPQKKEISDAIPLS